MSGPTDRERLDFAEYAARRASFAAKYYEQRCAQLETQVAKLREAALLVLEKERCPYAVPCGRCVPCRIRAALAATEPQNKADQASPVQRASSAPGASPESAALVATEGKP
jgi:hypothetical protein